MQVEIARVVDTDEAERFADRIRLHRAAAPASRSEHPGASHLDPTGMERRNASLVGGSINGGTAALDQQLIFRPIPAGSATTPIRGLYLASPQRIQAVPCTAPGHERGPPALAHGETYNAPCPSRALARISDDE